MPGSFLVAWFPVSRVGAPHTHEAKEAKVMAKVGCVGRQVFPLIMNHCSRSLAWADTLGRWYGVEFHVTGPSLLS